jgi:hypothetical protein
MTEREGVKLKIGQEFYIVVMSCAAEMYNPFLRHIGAISTTKYCKPLGIFKTKLISIDEYNVYSSWTFLSGYIDTSEFKDLLLPEGRYDRLPKGKLYTDYASFSCDRFVAMDQFNGKKTPNAEFIENMFLTESEAKDYYNKKMKAFNKNVKSFLSNLENNIQRAYKDIEDAKKQIEKFKNVI